MTRGVRSPASSPSPSAQLSGPRAGTRCKRCPYVHGFRGPARLYRRKCGAGDRQRESRRPRDCRATARRRRVASRISRSARTPATSSSRRRRASATAARRPRDVPKQRGAAARGACPSGRTRRTGTCGRKRASAWVPIRSAHLNGVRLPTVNVLCHLANRMPGPAQLAKSVSQPVQPLGDPLRWEFRVEPVHLGRAGHPVGGRPEQRPGERAAVLEVSFHVSSESQIPHTHTCRAGMGNHLSSRLIWVVARGR